MKILVIQITRPGDIYCTWPTLSALRRKYPAAEIHLLVRKKFYQAAKDFYVVDHFWHLDSEKIFEEIIVDPLRHQKAFEVTQQFIHNLKQEKFDEIINLSFSTSSSFITHLVAGTNTIVKGYSRTSDFYLHIPDEASRYFKSHVGVNKSNRIHVIDLFAMVAQVELQNSDLKLYKYSTSKNGVACHMGASQAHKMWPKEKWLELIQLLLTENKKVVLVGGKEDIHLGEFIQSHLASEHLENLISKTSFAELAKALSSVEFFIGGDSGPLHVANAVGCRSINLSVGSVNFWETGPTVPGSMVLRALNPEHLSAQEVYLTIKNKNKNAFMCDGEKMVRFDDQTNVHLKGWPTILWINFGGSLPDFSYLDREFLKQLGDICDLAMAEIAKIANNQQANFELLSQLDDVLQVMAETSAVIAPLIDYFKTEKANILPAEQSIVATDTIRCYQWLQNMAKKGILPHDGKLLENP